MKMSVRYGFALALLVFVGWLWSVFDLRSPAVAVKRIGVVRLTEVDNRTFEGFREGMTRLGYIEQQHVRYLVGEPSKTTDAARTQLQDLLAQGVDALLVSSTPVTQIAKELTGKQPVPVIFAPVNDPVTAGVVNSLKEPGGNITGIRLPSGDKLRLQWLRDLSPQVHKVLVVLVPYTQSDQSAQASLRELRDVATVVGVELVELPLREQDDMASIIGRAPRADAIFLPRDSRIEARIKDWLAYANQHRLPMSAPSLLQVEQGALYSYGFMHREIGIQAARLMDQVLRGTPPGALPVETADSFLGINLRAANAIGLPIPDLVIRQASLVIRQE